MHMACEKSRTTDEFGRHLKNASPNGTAGQGGMVCDRCVSKATLSELHEVLHRSLVEWYIRRENWHKCLVI